MEYLEPIISNYFLHRHSFTKTFPHQALTGAGAAAGAAAFFGLAFLPPAAFFGDRAAAFFGFAAFGFFAAAFKELRYSNHHHPTFPTFLAGDFFGAFAFFGEAAFLATGFGAALDLAAAGVAAGAAAGDAAAGAAAGAGAAGLAAAFLGDAFFAAGFRAFFGLAFLAAPAGRGFADPAAFGARAFFGRAAAFFGDAAPDDLASANLNDPDAPVPFTCFRTPDLTPRRNACFSWEFT
jgi:hypothetical protein